MRTALVLTLLIGSLNLSAFDQSKTPAEDDTTYLVDLYKHLHENPELSFEEHATSARMAKELESAGYDVVAGVGMTGVVGVLLNGSGPTVMIRTDMDALPILEQTGLPYASKAKGKMPAGDVTDVMHACGHDVHMAVWVGTARRMIVNRDSWSGTLIMIAQPAEELGRGAMAMLDDGLFARFGKPHHVLGLHTSWMLPAGTIGYTEGYALANVDSLDIVVNGVGGHGAMPHVTKDPVVLAARIITALQTLVAREIDPQSSGVVTVGAIHGGFKRNVIPDEVRLQLTIRSYSDSTRKLLLDGVARIAQGEALAAGIPADRMPIITREEEFIPAVFNTKAQTDRVIAALVNAFGRESVVTVPATMGGEDFSRYWLANQESGSTYFWLGAVAHEKWTRVQGDLGQLPSVHSSQFAPDPQPTISTGVAAMTTAALSLLATRP